ncbi:MAG: hypothetical protein EHM21_03990 [Chloroflexi bacterium]|nr:MAG: hypothetical protein EHM21_03990 [Chloroflexota bacterium]
MTKNQKIFIFIGGGIGLLCLVSCAAVMLFFRNVGSAITNNAIKSPEEVQAAAQEVATIDMPFGYSATEGMNILGITMAIYKSSSSDVFIMLMQMPTSSDLNQSDIGQMQQAFDRQYSSRGYQMQVVDVKDVTIRGNPGKVIISEGSANGVENRQVTVFFEGNNGLAALFITGPINQWDTAAYDQMIQSIR